MDLRNSNCRQQAGDSGPVASRQCAGSTHAERRLRQAVGRQYTGSMQAAGRQYAGSRLAVSRQYAGSMQAVCRQYADSRQAGSRQA